MIAVPSPRISIASFEAKWINLSKTWAGQLMLIHLHAASSSDLNSSVPQDGQCLGNFIGRSLPFRNSINGLTMYGITSPALSTSTVSPTRISFSRIMSSLKSETDFTVTPPMCTGSILATGPIFPVLPTWYSIPVSYTHLRAHETPEHLVCRLLLEKKKKI